MISADVGSIGCSLGLAPHSQPTGIRVFSLMGVNNGNGTMQGWIKLHRTLLEHPFWLSEPFTKAQAWVDLILLANHRPDFFFAAGQKVPVDRGQVGRSLLTLGKRWKWSRGKVNRFMSFLEKEAMISLETGQHSSIVTICNYNTFQRPDKDSSTSNGTPDGHQTDTKQDTNKNVNNDKNGKKLIKPDILELTEAFKEKRCPHPQAEAQSFLDYYESVGWQVGKNKKMMSWRGAVGSWMRRKNIDSPVVARDTTGGIDPDLYKRRTGREL